MAWPKLLTDEQRRELLRNAYRRELAAVERVLANASSDDQQRRIAGARADELRALLDTNAAG